MRTQLQATRYSRPQALRARQSARASRRESRSCADIDAARFPPRTPDASRAVSSSSGRLLLRETEFIHRRIALVIGGGDQNRAHSISNLQAGVGLLRQNRSNRRTIIQYNHADRKRRFNSLSLVEMDSSERTQFPPPGERFGLQLFYPRAADFTSIPLRREKYVAASAAVRTVQSRLRRAGIQI